jgi:hypothetical protein
MKNILGLSLLFLLSILYSFGQEISLLIIEEQQLKPAIGVTVYTTFGREVGRTNENGFLIFEKGVLDSLVTSYIAYDQETFPLDSKEINLILFIDGPGYFHVSQKGYKKWKRRNNRRVKRSYKLAKKQKVFEKLRDEYESKN